LMRYYRAVIEGAAVMASDLHCRPGRCRAPLLARLARILGAESLIVLGDLFDDMHRLVSPEELRRALKCAFGDTGGLEVYYVTSGSSHDPILPRDLHFEAGGLRVHAYPGPLVARVDGVWAFLTHGDIALRNGAHAFLVNVAAAARGVRLYLEKRLRRALRLPPSWWLIMGHTHIPGMDRSARVANTGSWRELWVAGLPYWRPPSNTFILVEGGELRLARLGGEAEEPPWLRRLLAPSPPIMKATRLAYSRRAQR